MICPIRVCFPCCIESGYSNLRVAPMALAFCIALDQDAMVQIIASHIDACGLSPDSACEHLVVVEGAWQTDELSPQCQLASLMVALVQQAPHCPASAGTLSDLISIACMNIDDSVENRDGVTDPLKRHHIRRGATMRRIYDEDYKHKLIATMVEGSICPNATPYAKADSVPATAALKWSKAALEDHITACGRCLGESIEGTFHLREDGTRLGRPKKRDAVLQLLSLRSEGDPHDDVGATGLRGTNVRGLFRQPSLNMVGQSPFVKKMF